MTFLLPLALVALLAVPLIYLIHLLHGSRRRVHLRIAALRGTGLSLQHRCVGVFTDITDQHLQRERESAMFWNGSMTRLPAFSSAAIVPLSSSNDRQSQQ